MHLHIHTLGPLGPFLQRGVEVVSQLAHRRASRLLFPEVQLFPFPQLLLPLPMVLAAEEEYCFGCWIKSQQKLGMQEPPDDHRSGSDPAVKRVDGVPRERVQSTGEL